MDAKVAVIGEDGWQSISESPDTDRKIQFAWRDMNYGDNSYAFYNTESDIWELRLNDPMYMISPMYLGAWRDIPK